MPGVPESAWELAERTGRVLFDKGSSRYYVQVFCRWPGERKSKRHRIYADSEGEARKILRRIQARIAHGAPLYAVLTDYVGDRSRNAFLKRWRAFCKEKEQDARDGVLTARRAYELGRYEDRGYLEFFESIALNAIDKKALTAWVRWMRRRKTASGKRLGEKTIKNVLHDLGYFLRWLHEQGDMPECPSVPAREIRVTEYDPQISDAEVVERVLAEIPESKRGIFLVRSKMGLRPSEARRLNLADLKPGRSPDLGDAAIHIPAHSSKMRKGRRLHPEVAAWLAEHGHLGKRFGAEPLFPNPKSWNDDGRWTATSERRVLGRVYKAAGVEWIKPNEFGRHFFATHAVSDLNSDIYPVQAWLGHTDPTTTQRYAKLRAVPIARIIGDKPKRGPRVLSLCHWYGDIKGR